MPPSTSGSTWRNWLKPEASEGDLNKTEQFEHAKVKCDEQRNAIDDGEFSLKLEDFFII